jgi:hypothetical protein
LASTPWVEANSTSPREYSSLSRSRPSGVMVAASQNAGARADSGLRGRLSELDGAADRSNLTG